MIEKVIEILTPPEAWTKGAYARTAAGNPIGTACDNAACFCIEGAARRADPGWEADWPCLIGEAVRDQFPCRSPVGLITSFNDHPHTTHADVLLVLRRARELEIAAGA